MKKDKKPMSERSRRAAESVRAFAAYLGCLAISLIVTYYFNGMVGILTATALICAFIVSLAVTLAVMPFIKVDARLDKSTAAKGEAFLCVINVSKRIIIPSPIIEIYVGCTPQLESGADVCRISLAGTERNTVTVPLTAKYSGAAAVTIREVLISDFLGIFRFRLKNAAGSSPMNISVYPNIPEVPVQTDFLKTTARFSGDDEEEESGETSSVQTGLPGYDHREYYPGDPIKRINWKLSSKRDIYMIRLDEKPAGSGQVFFLDVPGVDENDISLSVRDRVIEGMLAVFTMIIREGREIVFFCAEKDLWLKTDIRNSADIYALQEKLAGLSANEISVKETVPPEIPGLGKTPICFTCALSGFEQSAVQIASECPDALIICASSSGLTKITENMWQVNENFELKKLY